MTNAAVALAVDAVTPTTTPQQPPYAVGQVVWARNRPPQYSYQGLSPHGCWPGVLRGICEMGHYHADPVSGWWCDVAPCGLGETGRTVLLATDKGEVSDRPCAECLGLWAAWQWSGLLGKGMLP